MNTLIVICLTAAILHKTRHWLAKRRLLVEARARRHQLIGQAAAAAVEAIENEQLSLAWPSK
jgi:uncharacterized iron-regulated membrane protein